MRTLSLAVLVLGIACNTESDSDGDGGDTSDAVTSLCPEPAEVECESSLVQDLSYQEDVTDGAVTTTTDGDDFVTVVDATAGGMNAASQNPWVYVRFTEDGAERVDISDEDSLTDMTWHVSARRYILRLNGGTSGPSCVGAAAFIGSEYDDLTSVPDGVSYLHDDYYTDDCTLTNESSGLPNSPQVVLSPWWNYEACVATSGTPFLIELDDGKVIKFVVEEYYESGQETCNETGTTPGQNGAMFTWRWRYVE